MANKSKEIMDAREVADYLKVHLFTVHKYARQGKLPGFKIGADWRFNRKSIERWIREREQYSQGQSKKEKKQKDLI